jgi:hypothetical protein
VDHSVVKNLIKNKINGGDVEPHHKPIINHFISYLDAYCSELKFTDCEVVYDDEHFEKVWGIYKSIYSK